MIYNKMSIKRKDLEKEIELLKVKLAEMEKRFDLLERTMTYMDRTHRAEIMTLGQTNANVRNTYDDTTTSDDTSESEGISDEEELVTSSTLIEKANGKNNRVGGMNVGMMRRAF
jgi:predicted RNase H-like nuclease (RuvC/YqgF family)